MWVRLRARGCGLPRGIGLQMRDRQGGQPESPDGSRSQVAGGLPPGNVPERGAETNNTDPNWFEVSVTAGIATNPWSSNTSKLNLYWPWGIINIGKSQYCRLYSSQASRSRAILIWQRLPSALWFAGLALAPAKRRTRARETKAWMSESLDRHR